MLLRTRSLRQATLRTTTPRMARRAFTLVEILVVIAIIIILMSLTLVVMSKIWRTMDVTATTYEISKIQEGAERFKSAFGRYPLARIVLCESPAGWQAELAAGGGRGQLAEQSMEFLAGIFPGIELLNTGGYNYTDPVTNTTRAMTFQHDWSGRAQHQTLGNNNYSGNIQPGDVQNLVFYLEGEEAIFYFIGGMRYGDLGSNGKNRTVALGWSSAKQRPCGSPYTGGPARLGPYFDFQNDRVQYSIFNPSVNGLPQYNATNNGGFFPVYIDRFGLPYAYFRARSSGGGVNNYMAPGAGAVPIGYPGAGYLYDCDVMMTQLGSPGFVPYWSNCAPPASPPYLPQPPAGSQATFCKPDRFQIISAGRDKKFGQGGRLDPTNPEKYLVNANDLDNITNCTEGQIKP